MGSILKKRKREYDESKSPARKKFKKKPTMATLLASKTELKSVDVSSAAITQGFDATAPKQLLNATVPGNGISNRQGRRIRMKSLRIMGNVNLFQAGVAPTTDLIHMFLVYDTQPNGAAFAVGDLLQVTDSAGTTGTTNYAFNNISNAKRFKVLRHWKKNIVLGAGAAFNQPAQDSTDYLSPTTIDMYVKLNGLEVQYNTGSAGTIADINTGALYLMTFGGLSALNSQYQLRYNTRLRFEDS